MGSFALDGNPLGPLTSVGEDSPVPLNSLAGDAASSVEEAVGGTINTIHQSGGLEGVAAFILGIIGIGLFWLTLYFLRRRCRRGAGATEDPNTIYTIPPINNNSQAAVPPLPAPVTMRQGRFTSAFRGRLIVGLALDYLLRR